MRKEPFTVLLVDDNTWFLGILSSYLARHCGGAFTVVGTARTSAEALSLAAQLRPEVIILDVGLGSENGLDLIPRLRTPSTAVVVLSLHERSTHEAVALAAGADAFVAKANMSTDLCPASLHAVHALTGDVL